MNVVLKLSKLCNLRCVYCYEYEELGNAERMALDGLAHFLQELARHYREARWEAVLRFAFHGGEPLLLPAQYLRSVAELQQRHLAGNGVPFQNSVQTNLYRIHSDRLELLEELGFKLGVSLDVNGGQRVNGSGEDSGHQVRGNLQALVADGVAQRLGTAGISVLHAENVDRAVDTFEFFAGLGMNYRILPIFSMTSPPPRMRHLMLRPEQVVAAYQAVARARFAPGARAIQVYPLWDYVEAGVRVLSGRPAPVYDPRAMEWALIVNTNGDAYGHSEAYTPGYCFGNVFRENLTEVLRSGSRERLLADRAERARVCERCEFDGCCPRIPMVEALPNERNLDAEGRLHCAVARPMIEFMVKLISSNDAARGLTERARAASAEPYPA